MLNSLTLRCHDYMTPNRFCFVWGPNALFGPSGAGNYRSSICCKSCRGHKWSLGVSIRSCLEKSCVSKRHCPLTDIYLPLSLLFLFFFLALPFFFPLYLIFFLLSLRLGAKSLHCSQEPLQKTGWNLRLLDEPERVPLCPSASGALFPSWATAAGHREEDGDEDGDEDESVSASGEEKSGDEAQDNEDVVRVGSSAVAATHFCGELNVPLTF